MMRMRMDAEAEPSYAEGIDFAKLPGSDGADFTPGNKHRRLCTSSRLAFGESDRRKRLVNLCSPVLRCGRAETATIAGCGWAATPLVCILASSRSSMCQLWVKS